MKALDWLQFSPVQICAWLAELVFRWSSMLRIGWPSSSGSLCSVVLFLQSNSFLFKLLFSINLQYFQVLVVRFHLDHWLLYLRYFWSLFSPNVFWKILTRYYFYPVNSFITNSFYILSFVLLPFFSSLFFSWKLKTPSSLLSSLHSCFIIA